VRRVTVRGVVVAIGVLVAAAAVEYWRDRQVREALYAALAPVRITNCELQRFGSAHDGGYLMCGNLLTRATAAYSYGIDGNDAWGCDVAGPLRIPLHQYDCFNTTAPRCARGAAPQFHAECVGPARATIDGRPFDTMSNHIAANGHTGETLVVKMDVEGSEWQSLLTAPDHVLDTIDQLAIEFHRVEDRAFVDTALKLSQFFYVAHYHHNNYECRPGFEPFAGPVFELLLVNKRIAVANPSQSARGPSALDAPNNPALADCQTPVAIPEPRRVGRWLSRKIRGVMALF
jgi:hypothetical protein